MLATGYARGDGPSMPAARETVQDKLVAREAMRRAALAEHPAARKTSRGCATGR